MAFDGRVFRALIASPSDVEEEREIAVRVIQEWNDLYSYSRQGGFARGFEMENRSFGLGGRGRYVV